MFLQVSRCEKFGYGVMVTQVAATAPGAVALHSSGTEALTSCDPRGFLRSRHKADNEQPKEEHVCL